MLTLSLIPDEKWTLYQPLIPSHLQHAIASSSHQWIVCGAEQEGRAVGVILAIYLEHDRSASVQHLFVLPDSQRLGDHSVAEISAALLTQVATEAQKRGGERIFHDFLIPASELSERATFYQAIGWNPPEPALHVWSGDLRRLYEQPWVKHNWLPASFEVFSWGNLTREEREGIEQAENVWYPADLSPFPDAALLHPRYSLGLRHRGQVVGWLIIQPKTDDTVLLKTLFVQKPFQRMGRGISLFAEFLRMTAQDQAYPYGMVVVEEQNKPMIHFIESHCDPAIGDTKSLYRVEKKL